MKHALVAILLPVLLLCGCATKGVNESGERPRIYPTWEFKVFRKPPEKEYKSLGVMSVTSKMRNSAANRLAAIGGLLEQARQRGANAVIVLKEDAPNEGRYGATATGEAIIIEP